MIIFNLRTETGIFSEIETEYLTEQDPDVAQSDAILFSFVFDLSNDFQEYERTLYSFLDFAGQFGGFYELLEIAGYLIAGVYNSLAFDLALVNLFVSKTNTNNDEGDIQNSNRHSTARPNQVCPSRNQNLGTRTFINSRSNNIFQRKRNISNQNATSHKSYSLCYSLTSSYK